MAASQYSPRATHDYKSGKLPSSPIRLANWGYPRGYLVSRIAENTWQNSRLSKLIGG